MADNVFISTDVPLIFVDKNRSVPTTSDFKHFDQWLPEEQLLITEDAPFYPQKWQINDIIPIQIKSSFDPLNVYVFNCSGDLVLSPLQMTIVKTIGRDNYFEANLGLSLLTEGLYRVEIRVGSPVQLTIESNWLLVKQYHPGTLLFKYSRSYNDEVFYESGIYFNFRVEGVIKEYTPSGTRVVFLDQPQNFKTVKGVSNQQFKFIGGDASGIPPQFGEKIQNIFDCTDVEISGVGFSATDNAKTTLKREDGYGWVGVSVDISPKINRRGKLFTTTGFVPKKFTLDVMVQNKLFGPIGIATNDNTITITEVN